MEKLLTKYYSKINTHSLLTFLVITVLLPFLVLSFFNNPATDDFYLANLSLKYGLLDVHFWHYNNWSGRYFSNGILFFSPLYFGNFYFYKIIPIALILFFVYTVYFFVSNLFIKISIKENKAISSIIILLFFTQVPEACSAFYWLPGAFTYQFSIPLTLLFVGFYLKYSNTKKPLYLIIALLFLFFSMGCNEVTSLLNLILLLLYFIYNLWKTRKLDFAFLLVIVFAIVFACIELLAPGNAARANTISEKYNLIYAVSKSVIHSVLFTLKWIPLLLLFIAFYSENFYSFLPENKLKLKLLSPKWAFLILFSLLFISLFPGFFMQNNIIANRSLNSIYFYFILAAFYAVICSLIYLKDKYNFIITLSKSSKIVLATLMIFFTFSDNPVTNAYEDLLNGKAFSYNNQMKNRFNMIKNTSEKKVIVPALTKKPITIYQDNIMGLTNDVTNWKNEDISIYYDKSVTVEPTESIFTE